MKVKNKGIMLMVNSFFQICKIGNCDEKELVIEDHPTQRLTREIREGVKARGKATNLFPVVAAV